METIMTKHSELSGWYPSTDFLNSMTSVNSLSCVMACLHYVLCTSVFYNSVARNCLLINGYYHTNNGLVSAAYWDYYQPEIQLIVTIRTANDHGSGTNAKVFLKIYGSKGTTDEMELKDDTVGLQRFSTGRTDIFEIATFDVGTIQNITIGHDNTGAYASWRVSWVKIAVQGRSDVLFNIDRWMQDSQCNVTVSAP